MEKQEDNDGDQSKPIQVVAAVGGDGGVHSFFFQRKGHHGRRNDFSYNLGVRSYKKAHIRQ